MYGVLHGGVHGVQMRHTDVSLAFSRGMKVSSIASWCARWRAVAPSGANLAFLPIKSLLLRHKISVAGTLDLCPPNTESLLLKH